MEKTRQSRFVVTCVSKSRPIVVVPLFFARIIAVICSQLSEDLHRVLALSLGSSVTQSSTVGREFAIPRRTTMRPSLSLSLSLSYMPYAKSDNKI